MILEEYERLLQERPKDYFGEIYDWMDEGFSSTMFAHHRDSDILDESNWSAITSELDRYMEGNLPDEDVDDVRITSSNHWAVGWVETLHVRMRYDNGRFTNAFRRAVELKERMDIYPVLDEEDYSHRQFEDLCEYLEREVGPDNIEALAEYLFENYSVSSSEDVHYKWIEEWKENNLVQDC